MFGNLFIRVKEVRDFETCSKSIFSLLNLEIKETRYSENEAGGRYVYGEVLGLRVIFAEADDVDFVDYDFILSFRPSPQINWTSPDRHCLDGLADIVAKHLARYDTRIARPLEFGKAGTARVEYDGDNDS